MEILRIRPDVEQYQSILLSDPSAWSSGAFDFDCEKKSTWKCAKCYVHNPKLIRGNFMSLCPGFLVFDQITLDGMDDIMEMAGEILPLKVGDESYFGLNVLECVNALDERATKWRLARDSHTKIGISEYAFHANRMSESSLFKVPETAKGDLLVYRGLKDNDDEFIGRYERLGLTGLEFDTMFSQ